MIGVGGLLARYSSFVSLPWDGSGAPPQRVWFAVYDPADERRVRASLGAFEEASAAAGYGFRRCDLSRVFSAWLGSHRYREAYFRSPLELRGALGELREAMIAAIRSALAPAKESEVAAITGLPSLLGLVPVPDLVDAVREVVACRLLVFFPGSYEAGFFRFLESRETFTYAATPLVAEPAPRENGTPPPAAAPDPGPAETVLDALAAACARAARAAAGTGAAPAAVLWPDRELLFERLLGHASGRWPGLLTLGELDGKAEHARRGPAIWLRCRVDRTLPGTHWPAGTVPVIYLPGVPREQLRASEDSPWSFQTLADLRLRGLVFEPGRGADWSPRQLLGDRVFGPGLDLPADEPLLAALENVSGRLGAVPLERLRGRRVTPEVLYDAAVPDPADAVLSFLDDPRSCRNEMSDGEWEAFRSLLSRHFGLDLASDGPKAATVLLARRSGTWAHAWERLEKDPARFPGVAALLERYEPKGSDPSAPESSWPGTNRREEAALRSDLLALATLPPGKARALLPGLSAVHRKRRGWIWAKLGASPLAAALSPLGRLGKAAARPVAGTDPTTLAQEYAGRGSELEALAAEALSFVESPEDAAAVAKAAAALMGDAVAESARRTAEALGGEAPVAGPPEPPLLGECVVLVPSMSCAEGQKLGRLLDARGLAVSAGWRWAGRIAWAEADSLAESRIQVLAPDGTGAVSGRAFARTELPAALHGETPLAFARRQAAALEVLAERVAQLVGAGWARVRLLAETPPSPSPAFAAVPVTSLARLVVPVLSVEKAAPGER